MGCMIDIMATQANLAGMDPGEYVRFDTESHGTVMMVALKERLHNRSDDQAVHRFMVIGGGTIVIDAVPAEIRTDQVLSLMDDQVRIKITDLIHIGC